MRSSKIALFSASAALAGLATAQSSGTWTVNFYSSSDCSVKSLTSSFTGSDVYEIREVSPKGLYVKATNTDKAINGVAVAYSDNGPYGLAEFGGPCVSVPDEGASSFQIVE